MKTAEEAIIYGSITGVILFIILLIFVFATGSTFGQRCEKIYHDDISISNCVDRLQKGGKL